MLEQYINPQQLELLVDLRSNSEEKEFFVKLLSSLEKSIAEIPQKYEQDVAGSNIIAYLHYFTGAYDVYITEKDMGNESLQAYGYTNFGFGFEQGYVSIIELLETNFELDLYFDPKPIEVII